MKLRIKDSAVRFRLTLKEVEEIERTGRLDKETWFPPATEGVEVFRYSIAVSPHLAESRFTVDPFSMLAELTNADFETLASPEQEGVYIRREWTSADGKTRRFMVFVEKDRPGSTCVKPEEWIYEEMPGSRPQTRPIP